MNLQKRCYTTTKVKSWIENTLEQRFNLTVNQEKTKVIDLAKPQTEVNFLGYTLKKVTERKGKGRKFCLVTPSNKSLKEAFEEIREKTNPRNGFKPIPRVIKEINLFLRGWGQYFKLGNPSAAFGKVNRHVLYKLYKFLQRRSNRGYKKGCNEQTWYEHLKELGLIMLTKERYRMKAQG